jgi:hypothetical protein
MDNINNVIRNINHRQRLLSVDLKWIKNELEKIYDKMALESGVIDRGYFGSFNDFLSQNRHIVGRFMVSEEQYTDGTNGQILKVPIVDVMNGVETKRIFIIPQSHLRDFKIDDILK